MFRHNDLDLILPLEGAWRFSLAGGPERILQVPGAWEAETGDFLTEGPAVYTREVELGSTWRDCRVWLEVDAASLDESSSGIGDLILLGTLWFVNNPESKTYFAFSASGLSFSPS